MESSLVTLLIVAGPEEELAWPGDWREGGRREQEDVLARRARGEQQNHRPPVRQQQGSLAGWHDSIRRNASNHSRRYPISRISSNSLHGFTLLSAFLQRRINRFLAELLHASLFI